MGAYSTALPETRSPASRRLAGKLIRGQLLDVACDADSEATGDATVALLLPDTSDVLGYLPADFAAWVARALADSRDIAVRVRDVRSHGRLWWRRVVVVVQVLTDEQARDATGTHRR